MPGRRERPTEWELRQITAAFLYLYGVCIEPLFESGVVEVERSSKTGRIRHVYINGRLVLTLRSSDGFLVLTPAGWKLLRASGHLTPHVVETTHDVAEFVSQGRSLFSKHVIRANHGILPGDEVCIVSQPEGLIAATGRAVLPGEDMGLLKRGKAVRIRRGVKEENTC